MAVTRHFLGWDEPVIAAVRRFLFPEPVSGVADLEPSLIVVPTRQAGRRLREALALYCSERGTALLSAQVVPPEFFLRPARRAAGQASASVAKAVWSEVFLHADLEALSGLYPAGRPERDFVWALRSGEMIQQLRSELAEGGYRIADVVEKFGEQLEEPERWRDLAALERDYLQRLAARGLGDACLLRMRSADAVELAAVVQRVVVAAFPDPSLLVIRALQRLAERLPVEVLVHAPPALAGRFDEWGRPLPAAWKEARIEIPDPEANIILAATPEAQARQALRLIGAEASRYGPADAAVGVPDRTVVSVLEEALAENGLPAFDPADKPLTGHALYRLLEAFCGVLAGGAYADVAAVLRHPDFLSFCQASQDAAPCELLQELDEFQNAALPLGLADLLRARDAGGRGRSAPRESFPALSRAVRFLEERRGEFAATGVAAALRSFLQLIYAERTLQAQEPRDIEFRAAAEKVDAVLHELEDEAFSGLALPASRSVAILLDRLREQTYHRERPRAAVDLEGWLELAWNDAPLLLVTGMNEGCVPGGRLSDVFLPDALRARLGLRDDEGRCARDAYLMQDLIESRRRSGRVCFLCGKTGLRGDPLKPSRLLFRCADEELPARARQLFGTAPVERSHHCATISFKLDPRPPPDLGRGKLPLRRLSATAFRDYLACPFRFYLKHVLEMEALDDAKPGPDALDFGSMLHAVLERMARDEALRPCADEERLARFLCDEAARWTASQFGREPCLPVTVALEAAQQRLRAAAAVQARLAAEGWQIVQSEALYRVTLHGVTVSGKIDRIDRHAGTGRIRIIDYKSSDRPETPEDVHLGPAGSETREFARLRAAGRERRWTDLQLPLYRLLLDSDQRFAGPAELAYFALPRTVACAGVYAWEDFDEALYASAQRCAAGVIEAIRRGVFWPPAARLRYDDFGALFQGDMQSCFEPPELPVEPEQLELPAEPAPEG